MGTGGDGSRNEREPSTGSSTGNGNDSHSVDSISNLMDLRECIQDSPQFRSVWNKNKTAICRYEVNSC